MRNNFKILGLALLLVVSCRAPLAVSNVQTQKNIQITEALPDNSVAKMIITPYKKSLEAKMNEKLSYTAVELTKQGDNSNLGNLLADYTLDGARDWSVKNNFGQNIDAAVINIGGIRTNIGKGDILLKNIFEVMPFENELVVVKLSGEKMQGLFDYYLKTQKNNPVSGLVIETENNELTKMLVNGKPVENRDYYIATSDYLALGGDNMNFFEKGEMISTGIKLRDLYIDIVKTKKEVVPPSDIRLIFKDKAVK